MRKIILFSLFLIIGLIGSQTIPTFLDPASFGKLKAFFDALLYICLAFIMINMKKEFKFLMTKLNGNPILKTILSQWQLPQCLGCSFADTSSSFCQPNTELAGIHGKKHYC